MTEQGHSIHFVGIGGTGMSGLAKMLLRQGKKVSGSDARTSPVINQLKEIGAEVFEGHRASNVNDTTGLVVISAAIKEDNEEVQQARKMGIKILKYAQMLGLLMQEKIGIAISGTHGKTTTTAMIVSALKSAGLFPSFVIGANVKSFEGSSGIGTGNFFVAEACEYDRSFLNLYPRIGVVNNIEEDHLDYYRDIDDIVGAFGDFVGRIPRNGLAVINNQDRNIQKILSRINSRVQTFAVNLPADWVGYDLKVDNGCYRFSVVSGDEKIGRFQLSIPGVHNVLNALASIVVCRSIGIGFDIIQEALRSFRGADRRFEMVGTLQGVTVLDDYAHHPTEIQATLKAIRDYFKPGTLWCVFQPHQHSRTRFFLNDFARSFGMADTIIVPDIYFVRDSIEEKRAISSEHLVNQIISLGGNALYVPDFDEIMDILKKKSRQGDVIVTMGAGNVNEIAYRFIQDH